MCNVAQMQSTHQMSFNSHLQWILAHECSSGLHHVLISTSDRHIVYGLVGVDREPFLGLAAAVDADVEHGLATVLLPNVNTQLLEQVRHRLVHGHTSRRRRARKAQRENRSFCHSFFFSSSRLSIKLETLFVDVKSMLVVDLSVESRGGVYDQAVSNLTSD